ncbi:MAG: hypothetical protein AAGG51_17310 [Cyanobacteria bacterium P01_G01_bin.54]
MTPHFADLRIITHGAESAAQGYDPLLNNPADPWGRPLNYPRIWQLFYALGLNSSHTVGLALGFIASFLMGIILILPNASNRTLWLVTLALISPATLLGIERGNNDLPVFFVVAVTVCFAQTSSVLADIGILLGTVLKVFPIFGASLLLRMKKQQFVQHGLVILSVTCIYVVANGSDLKLISQATPRGTQLSYGMNVVWMGIDQMISHAFAPIARLTCVALVLLALGIIYLACTQPFNSDVTPDEVINLDAFRAGSSIYMGTFLLGNNWDYRLIFLIFVIPQLSTWMTSSSQRTRWLSRITLLTMFISMWHLLITKGWNRLTAQLPFPILRSELYPWFLDEMSNWLLFLLLCYLFALTLPPWFKSYLCKR